MNNSDPCICGHQRDDHHRANTLIYEPEKLQCNQCYKHASDYQDFLTEAGVGFQSGIFDKVFHEFKLDNIRYLELKHHE